MRVLNLFSKRQKRLRGELPDVYTYDDIPRPLRAQVIHILNDAIGTNKSEWASCEKYYKIIYDALCREYGVFGLTDRRLQFPSLALFDFFLSCDEIEKILDVVELSFQVVDQDIRKDWKHGQTYSSATPDDAISELNHRFREHGIGYEFNSGQIIRIDSTIMHSEVVKPVLQLLRERVYKGANEEFLRAHEHYRKGRYQECLNECLKAFESTMKAICDKCNWNYNQNDTASKLINTCFDNNLIPRFLQSEFAALRTILESGVPTARNKLSGHGQGTQQRKVPDHFASYVLHMTAANILFLIQSEKNLP